MKNDTKEDDFNPHEINGESSNCWCGKEAVVLQNNGEEIPNWIVEIEVVQHEGFETDIEDSMTDVPKMKYHLKYEDEEKQAFLRHDAVNRRMFPFDISRHINDQVRNHYEKIRDDLKKELHEELAKKGLPNKLEHLAPVEIEGTMRKQLGRPILSDVQRMLS
ncbi:Oidioi.mRNA.OKI2018_I69.PAR.g12440.t1.cds [Oikopleura dioica]|uniref:Oidioi.mRNA.OKI2018_I69.PAR.g12440.t1.cds n=1 Tax=Oikopleura dioica TaxID=34765 RepID=A0ABN7S011_OIKDI|nr:Oidioi.mRNA.OKI2018_I69.PAR.g12440.t1.cds [Oikopleura dioica]